MISNRHPADELAALCVRIRELKAREMALRKLLMHSGCSLQGDEHQVVFRKHKRRLFIKERLPDYVLSEPSLWETRYTTHMVSEKREVERPALRAVRPGDPVLSGFGNAQPKQDWGSEQFEVIEREGLTHQIRQVAG